MKLAEYANKLQDLLPDCEVTHDGKTITIYHNKKGIIMSPPIDGNSEMQDEIGDNEIIAVARYLDRVYKGL